MNLTLLDIFMLALGVFGSGFICYHAGKQDASRLKEKMVYYRDRLEEVAKQRDDLAERLDATIRTNAMVQAAGQIFDVQLMAQRAASEPNPLQKCACGRDFELGLMCNYCMLDGNSPGKNAWSNADVGLLKKDIFGNPLIPPIIPPQTNRAAQDRTEQEIDVSLNLLEQRQLQEESNTGEQARTQA